MNIKKLIAICTLASAAMILITLGYTTPYSVTTEVLTLDEIQAVDDVFDVNYLLYTNLLQTLDGAERDLNLAGTPVFGKVYITRSKYVLAADQMICSIPIAAQSAPGEQENWQFEFRVLSMAWTGGGLEKADAPAIERLSLQIDADTNIRYANGSISIPDAVSQDQMQKEGENGYLVKCFVSRGPSNVEPTTALWVGELVTRQGLRSQRFAFSLPCVTDYGG